MNFLTLLSVDERRIAFSIFNLDIYWYGILIVSGMVIAVFLAAFFLKRKGYNPELIVDIALLTFVLAIVGARLYYIIFTPGINWTLAKMVDVRSGGLAFYGGLIGGASGVLIVCRVKKLKFSNILDVLDSIAPGVLIAQSIGRWGNFINQEAYGDKVLELSRQRFPFAVFIENEGAWFQATFFYESFFNFISFVLLFILAFKLRGRYKGIVTSGYFILYGIVRTVVEGMRSDSLYWGSVRASQALSVIFVVLGIAAAITLYIHSAKIKADIPDNVKYNKPQDTL